MKIHWNCIGALSTWLGTGIASVAVASDSASASAAGHLESHAVVSLGDVCFSNPLLVAQLQQPFQKCLLKGGDTTDNNNNATASHYSTTTTSPTSSPDVEDEDDDDGTSSGGWTGPHACLGPYCVYAHTTFASGRGLVLISEGDSANALANSPIIVDLAASASSSSVSDEGINTQSNGIITKEIPGKGRGFVATRPIHRGERIMAYTPALIIQRGFFDFELDSPESDSGSDSNKMEQLRVLRDAVSRLPPRTRLAFWKQLGQSHNPDSSASDNDILNIVINNSFNLPLTNTKDTPFVGNFPEVSMYNHDCRPSVAFHLAQGIIHTTHAVSPASNPIAEGEELSISYIDSFRARQVRRDRTRRNWGFECACAQCVSSAGLANASDHRLWRIYEVENALILPAASNSLPNTRKSNPPKNVYGGRNSNKQELEQQQAAVADRIELLLSLYTQERLLHSHGSSAYRTAALNYNSLKRRELAIKYALLALEQYILEEGASSGAVREMVALLDEPEGHWSWGRRV